MKTLLILESIVIVTSMLSFITRKFESKKADEVKELILDELFRLDHFSYGFDDKTLASKKLEYNKKLISNRIDRELIRIKSNLALSLIIVFLFLVAITLTCDNLMFVSEDLVTTVVNYDI